MPKVSINILTHNRSWLLLRALDSVAKQSFKDYEVVIINNGSTDNTLQALDNYKNQPTVKIISLPINIGITAARQKALENSSGEYIAILDDDDKWVEPEKLKAQVDFLDKNPDYVLVGGGIEFVQPDLKSSNVKMSGGIKLRPKTDAEIRN